MSIRLLTSLFLLTALPLAALEAKAEPPAPDVQVTSTIDQVKQIVKSNPDGPAVDRKLKDILFPLFDWDAMSRSSLGPNWAKATQDEQKQFIDLFSALLSKTYMHRVKAKVNESTVEVKESKVSGPKAIVKTIVTADQKPVNIEYRMQSANDKWQVYDVLVENVGLISNYRVEFGEIVRKEGMQGLLQKLKAKQTEKTAA